MNTNSLISWYLANKRDLPWRHTREPYLIWLSEIILQQTRVNQGIGYYHKFCEHFPSIKDLAEASLDRVFELWQGLGYYTRAKNLHQAAQAIYKNGKFPDTYSELLKIKGIGNYTAAAIASFAFDEAVAVLDGNVMRVLSRHFDVKTNILSGAGRKQLQSIADQLLPIGQSALYNQAIMELGALVCKPQKPDCLHCPIRESCLAFSHKTQENLPVRIKNTNRKTRKFNYLVICNQESILLRKRTSDDIWQGLYEFYKLEEHEDIQLFARKQNFDFQYISPMLSFTHKLTHQDLVIDSWLYKTKEPESLALKFGLEVFSFEQANQIGKPAAISKILEHLRIKQGLLDF